MKKLLLLLTLICFYSCSKGELKDTTVTIKYDSLVCGIQSFTKDSTYKIDVAVSIDTLRGMYITPDNLTIGNTTSENSLLTYCRNKGVNMLNLYARAFLYTQSNRTLLAAFVRKSRTCGIKIVTVDVRLTDSRELPGWQNYLPLYSGTTAEIEPLTEFEPYIKNSLGVYDYAGFFNLVRTMHNLCGPLGIKLNYYTGWVGNNYVNPQAAVDSMVKHCDRIFLSNYVSVSDFTSTSSSLGYWDSRMDKRCNMIAAACPQVGKTSIEMVEIESLETIYLQSYYSTLGQNHSFYGSVMSKVYGAFRLSTAIVLNSIILKGTTRFTSKYCKQAQPN